jgi:hypothetical protein
MTKKIITKKPVVPEKVKAPLVPEKYQDLVFIMLLVLAVFIFFGGAIFGGGFHADDNIASASTQPFLEEAGKEGRFPLWMPYIFCGMPSYASLLTSGTRVWDILPLIFFGIPKLIGALFNSDVARLTTYYALYGIGIYWLLRTKGHERPVAFVSALGAAFSTWIITWIMIGHNTKPIVFAMLPYMFIFTEKLIAKFSILYLVLLVIALHIMMEAGHLQMIFYSACAVGIYLIYELVYRSITRNKPLYVIITEILLVVAGCIAFFLHMIFYSACALGIYLIYELVYRIITKNKSLYVIKAGLLLSVATCIAFLMS